jgi:hypothetical protein
MKKYTIKSTSDEGVFYLVNGWYKHKKIWISEEGVMRNTESAKRFFFKQPWHAEASLTKLLKVMPEYSTDKFELAEF